MLKDLSIDYALLVKAKEYYANLGYEYIETPWIVDEMSAKSTCRHSSDIFILDDGQHMVGSGEQSFIQLCRDRKLVPDKFYMTITPCFRRGENDSTHAEQFIKLELFSSTAQLNTTVKNAVNLLERESIVSKMMKGASDCYAHLGLDPFSLYWETLEKNNNLIDRNQHVLYTISNSDINFDLNSHIGIEDIEDELNVNPLELGSYGMRREKIVDSGNSLYRYYYYGTGLALPRFQLALQK
jgi:elongation factor P--beta-lysine ligase